MKEDGVGLWLIGVGPGDIELMSLKAINGAKKCKYRFLEGYTALLPKEEEEKLEDLVGPFQKIMRTGVEKPTELLKLAKNESVALMVVGDPLQATTHVDLQLRAEQEDVLCHVIHGISITTIVTGAVGLQSYRFGRQVTLAYPYGDYLPTSPLELIIENKKRNLHSLVLLDLDPTGSGEGLQKPMSPSDAIEIIKKAALMIEINIDDWEIILCSDMGTMSQNIKYGSLGDISAANGGKIHCLIIPAKLDQLEQEAVLRWK